MTAVRLITHTHTPMSLNGSHRRPRCARLLRAHMIGRLRRPQNRPASSARRWEYIDRSPAARIPSTSSIVQETILVCARFTASGFLYLMTACSDCWRWCNACERLAGTERRAIYPLCRRCTRLRRSSCLSFASWNRRTALRCIASRAHSECQSRCLPSSRAESYGQHPTCYASAIIKRRRVGVCKTVSTDTQRAAIAILSTSAAQLTSGPHCQSTAAQIIAITARHTVQFCDKLLGSHIWVPTVGNFGAATVVDRRAVRPAASGRAATAPTTIAATTCRAVTTAKV